MRDNSDIRVSDVQESLFPDVESKIYTCHIKGSQIESERKEKQVKLSIVYGTCCKCHEQPATLKSPSCDPEYIDPGKIYCSQCGTSRCGIHTIEDFEREESTGLWLDPCVANHGVQVKQEALGDGTWG